MNVPDTRMKQKELEKMGTIENYLRRLKAHRWLVVAVIIIFFILVASDQMSIIAGVLSVIALFLAAMLSPVRSKKTSRHLSTRLIDDTLPIEQIQSLMNAIPDPVILVGKNGEVTFTNTESRSVFENIGIGSQLMLRFRDPTFQAGLRNALAGHDSVSVEYVEPGPSERWFLVSFQVLSNFGISKIFMIHFRDLTETRRTDKVRSDFIANASHELRTPLASLLGFIETLSGPARDDVAARNNFLKIMQDQAERMSRLIDDLLALSRFETARGRANFKPVELVLVLNHVVDALHPMADQSEAVIEVDIGEMASDAIYINGNRDELIQLFENLVENAIKYGKRGGVVNITLNLAAQHNVIIAVSDDGPGIAKEHIPRLVERFYRVDVDKSRGKQGTGLGLSIVRHIIQRHKGQLNIKSELGKGTSFMVTLPMCTKNNSGI